MGNNNMSPLGPKKKGIRFNLYWMYSLIALVLIGLYYMNDNTMSKEVNRKNRQRGRYNQTDRFRQKRLCRSPTERQYSQSGL